MIQHTMEFDSWAQARTIAHMIANESKNPCAIYKPFNSDSYCIVTGEDADIAMNSENFVEWIMPDQPGDISVTRVNRFPFRA